VVVLAGTNGNVVADVFTIHETLRDAGLRTVACTIPPSTASTLSAVAAFNARLQEYAADRGVPCCDVHASVVDTTTGAYQSALNGDGVHPSQAGYRAMGYAIATTLNDFLGASQASPLVGHNSAINGQLQSKPLALASPTSGVEYYTLSGLGTSTIAVAANSAFLGGQGYLFTRGDTNIDAVMVNAALVAGHRMRIGMSLAAAVGSSWGMRLESNTTGGKVLWGMGYPTEIGLAQPAGRFYSEFTVPTLPDYVYRAPRISVSGSGTTVHIGEVTIQDLTAMGLA
jgi:hypothetical protein